MFSVIEHIEYLLSRYDCVTIPGWGAFIAQYVEARYDEDCSLLSCPRRTISFNAQLDHNDGLLAQSLMKHEGVTYDEAMRQIADCVKVFTDQLSAGCEVPIARLGRFVRNGGQINEFVPFDGVGRIDSFYGLKAVEILTVEALEKASVDEEHVSSVVPGRRNPFIRKALEIAASVVVLLGLSVLLTTPIVVNRDQLDQASMAPTVTAPQPQQLGVTIQEGVAPQEITLADTYPGITGVGSTSGKYYMVIATLRNQPELDAFKNKYPELVPLMKTVDYKGMMCVYVARSDNYSKLLDLRDELPKPLRNAWIFN